METSLNLLEDLLKKTGMSEYLSGSLSVFLGLIIIIILAWVVLLITRHILLEAIHRIAKKTTTHWDDVLIENKFCRK